MCGIAGILKIAGQVQAATIQDMTDVLRHRGPDASGVWIGDSGSVGLGHRRLSIIDLSDSGAQPMCDHKTGCVVVFNGEIYNYKELKYALSQRGVQFRGESDTEVLLACYLEWDVTCLARLEGMFAFAIYDPRRSRLFLARDRAGEKPLFYKNTESGFYFGSELKAILSVLSESRRVNIQSLASLLLLGYVPPSNCILDGYSKLRAGHALVIGKEQTCPVVWQYWKAPDGDKENLRTGFRSDVDYVDHLGSILKTSIRQQLVADVPVGILLSGGLDSSLVAAIASEVSATRIKTFTMTFPGGGKFDESRYARSIANHFGSEHYELVGEPSSLDLLPLLAEQFDEPMIDSSMVPMYQVSKLIRSHAKVALGGDGGDELFGGYTSYKKLSLAIHINSILPVSDSTKALLLRCVSRLYGEQTRGRNYLPALEALCSGFMPNPRGLFSQRELNALLSRELLGQIDWTTPSRQYGRLVDFSDGVINSLCRADFENYFVEDILTKVDRSSMLTSLEVRAPFLSRRVVEFALGVLPDHLKVSGDARKIVLRKLAERYFPENYNYDRKQGFSVPIFSWLKGEAGKVIRELIMENQIPLFNYREMERYLKLHRVSHGFAERIFAVAMVSLWWRRYQITL